VLHISFWYTLKMLIIWAETYLLLKKKNKKALVVASKEIRLEVNTDTTM